MRHECSCDMINKECIHDILEIHRSSDKSLALPDWKKQLKGRHFSSDAEVIATAEIWFDGKILNLFWVACKS